MKSKFLGIECEVEKMDGRIMGRLFVPTKPVNLPAIKAYRKMIKEEYPEEVLQDTRMYNRNILSDRERASGKKIWFTWMLDGPTAQELRHDIREWLGWGLKVKLYGSPECGRFFGFTGKGDLDLDAIADACCCDGE